MRRLISNSPRRVTQVANSPTIKNTPPSSTTKYKAALCTMAKPKTTSSSTPKMKITSASVLEHSTVALAITMNHTSDIHIGSTILVISSWALIHNRGDTFSQGRSSTGTGTTRSAVFNVGQYGIVTYYLGYSQVQRTDHSWSSCKLKLPNNPFADKIQPTISCHFHLKISTVGGHITLHQITSLLYYRRYCT